MPQVIHEGDTEDPETWEMRWGTYKNGNQNTWKYDTNTTATKGAFDPLGNLTLMGRGQRYGISLCRIVMVRQNCRKHIMMLIIILALIIT